MLVIRFTKCRRTRDVYVQALTEREKRASFAVILRGGEDIRPASPLVSYPHSSFRRTSDASHHSGKQNKVAQHFRFIFKTILACLIEALIYVFVWVAFYVTNVICEQSTDPVESYLIITLHTLSCSLLYSLSYNRYRRRNGPSREDNNRASWDPIRSHEN